MRRGGLCPSFRRVLMRTGSLGLISVIQGEFIA
jgi:hypothetical protein